MRFLITNFGHDVMEWGVRTAVWNVRFLVGMAVLPGSRKKVRVR